MLASQSIANAIPYRPPVTLKLGETVVRRLFLEQPKGHVFGPCCPNLFYPSSGPRNRTSFPISERKNRTFFFARTLGSVAHAYNPIANVAMLDSEFEPSRLPLHSFACLVPGPVFSIRSPERCSPHPLNLMEGGSSCLTSLFSSNRHRRTCRMLAE